jgi:transcriptional regulator NrdR family protein
MLPVVIKRDGAKEQFSVINISKVAMASGLSPEQAKQIAEVLVDWAKSLQKEFITSLEIRDKMLEELKKINVEAAQLYEWYEQSKEE